MFVGSGTVLRYGIHIPATPTTAPGTPLSIPAFTGLLRQNLVATHDYLLVLYRRNEGTMYFGFDGLIKTDKIRKIVSKIYVLFSLLIFKKNQIGQFTVHDAAVITAIIHLPQNIG